MIVGRPTKHRGRSKGNEIDDDGAVLTWIIIIISWSINSEVNHLKKFLCLTDKVSKTQTTRKEIKIAYIILFVLTNDHLVRHVS